MDWDDILLIGVVSLILVFIAFSIYLAFFAPCSYVGWMSITNVPARCTTLVK